MSDIFELYNYRLRVAAMYQERNRTLLNGEDAESVCKSFRAARDALFATHPQSALDEEQRTQFSGLRYFPYAPSLCVEAEVDTSVEPAVLTVAMDAQEMMTMTRVAHVRFLLDARQITLAVYWLNVYGGGLFLPFRDTSSPAECYGGGRYLFDTIKGSNFLLPPGELSMEHIILDFNYAYNPSCAYNPRWVCPLAPVENRLDIAIRAGEKNFH